ncbi:hypothetical protein psyc5s11_08790 [Clostridium gelidum]|uniref:Uncharacterized protein n=1 Tax=Clostridium gelidum TaxID=704125 RepID=A0ABM7SYW4_9CLOT|nr:hypothetical protein psyc5s11_08790 [Clostridium gelidum]
MIIKKDAYIMITQTGTKFSRVLQLFTHAPYNHASIALDENLESLYSFARQNLYIPIFAGFVKEDINKGVYKLHDNTLCKIYRISISEKQYLSLQKSIEEFERNEDKYSYNFVGLLTMLFNIPYHREHHYVCSQFVAYLLHDSKSINFEKHFSLVRPQDFTSLSELNLIYSGKLSNYTA